ncbi:oxygen-dependent tRNA uridine(34) hydroxylase TrhO [Kordiimonas aestuarii]|uniref:oxygen-dependent tRNA uridine(34) hydroxylase TrhO n=1 Tax=Kordiimonas aestuarii TaxID=1005925 RepID=UPI0021D29FB2|nr:rhodanese-related sulfurtransferase [Kordiimonas aestuarii]
MSNYLVAALYKFVRLPEYEALQAPITEICIENNVKGTLLLAAEGINGTIAGPEDGLRRVLAYLRTIPAFEGLVHKESWADKAPFLRMKVRLKKEIVTMGVEGIDPNRTVGTYVQPGDWNALISDPDTIVVDTRNDYEVAIGTFKGAVDPKTKSFREFPSWAAENKDLLKKPKVAMFCTGGIRCEKSTAYMKEQGYDEVYHLEGGILKYLEEVPEDESLWEGDCFVFDERVSVRHGLEPGDYHMCRACRRPVAEEEMALPEFVEGVSCPYCHEETSEEQKERFAERQKQIMLAKRRGEKHIGITKPRAPEDEAEQPLKAEGA